MIYLGLQVHEVFEILSQQRPGRWKSGGGDHHTEIWRRPTCRLHSSDDPPNFEAVKDREPELKSAHREEITKLS